MDIFDSRYYKLNRRLMKSIGQWPYENSKQRGLLSVLMYVSIGSILLVQALKLNELWGDVDEMFQSIVPMGVEFVACLKSLNCISNNAKMKRLLDMMKEDWARVTDEEELEILIGYAERGSMLGALYLGESIEGSLSIFLMLPLTPQILDLISPLNETRPRRFLYQAEYYVNPEDYYTSIMVHNYFSSIYTILVIVTVDMMLLAYVHHMCGIFTIIGHRIKNSMKYTKNYGINGSCRTIDSENFYIEISNCIKDHKQVLEFGNLIEDSYSTTFLFQIAIAMLMMSATGLQVIAHLGDYDEVFRHGQLIFGQLFHLYVNCWTGQMLVDHTSRFRESAYFAEWYSFPLGARQLLRLAMLRSLKPCKMTAGKIYDMSIENYGKVIQTSMSWFTVLVSMR